MVIIESVLCIPNTTKILFQTLIDANDNKSMTCLINSSEYIPRDILKPISSQTYICDMNWNRHNIHHFSSFALLRNEFHFQILCVNQDEIPFTHCNQFEQHMPYTEFPAAKMQFIEATGIMGAQLLSADCNISGTIYIGFQRK